MSYEITESSLEKIIRNAVHVGVQAGEMRVMGSGDWRGFIEKAIQVELSNAKSNMLRDYEAARRMQLLGGSIT